MCLVICIRCLTGSACGVHMHAAQNSLLRPHSFGIIRSCLDTLEFMHAAMGDHQEMDQEHYSVGVLWNFVFDGMVLSFARMRFYKRVLIFYEGFMLGFLMCLYKADFSYEGFILGEGFSNVSL